MPNKKYLATITVLVKGRQMHANDVNRILTEKGHMV